MSETNVLPGQLVGNAEARFDETKAERDALYQATRPVEGSWMAWALELDRRAEQKTRDAEALRLRRASVLAQYQQPRAGDVAQESANA